MQRSRIDVICGSSDVFQVDAVTGRVLTPTLDVPLLVRDVVRVDLDEYRQWNPTPGSLIQVALIHLIRCLPDGREIVDEADAQARQEVDSGLADERRHALY